MFLTIAKIDKNLFEGEFKSVSIPATKGAMQIFPDHQPMIISLKDGIIKVVDSEDNEKEFEIKKGFVEINKKEVNIVL